MGQFVYCESHPGVEFDDRLLAHLKVVIFAKLRRHESFAFSWDHGLEGGGGRSSIWLGPAIPMRFTFSGSKPASLNRTWVEQLMVEANSPAGLQIVPEPKEKDAE
jgi:hypothetical protein